MSAAGSLSNKLRELSTRVQQIDAEFRGTIAATNKIPAAQSNEVLQALSTAISRLSIMAQGTGATAAAHRSNPAATRVKRDLTHVLGELDRELEDMK